MPLILERLGQGVMTAAPYVVPFLFWGLLLAIIIQSLRLWVRDPARSKRSWANHSSGQAAIISIARSKERTSVGRKFTSPTQPSAARKRKGSRPASGTKR